MLVVTSAVASGSRSPTRLDPELSWAAPSSSWPLGCGEAGVDLLALVAHATQRGVVLAAGVALVGFVDRLSARRRGGARARRARARRLAGVRSRAGVSRPSCSRSSCSRRCVRRRARISRPSSSSRRGRRSRGSRSRRRACCATPRSSRRRARSAAVRARVVLQASPAEPARRGRGPARVDGRGHRRERGRARVRRLRDARRRLARRPCWIRACPRCCAHRTCSSWARRASSSRASRS